MASGDIATIPSVRDPSLPPLSNSQGYLKEPRTAGYNESPSSPNGYYPQQVPSRTFHRFSFEPAMSNPALEPIRCRRRSSAVSNPAMEPIRCRKRSSAVSNSAP
jgi:hypothetical protein